MHQWAVHSQSLESSCPVDVWCEFPKETRSYATPTLPREFPLYNGDVAERISALRLAKLHNFSFPSETRTTHPTAQVDSSDCVIQPHQRDVGPPLDISARLQVDVMPILDVNMFFTNRMSHHHLTYYISTFLVMWRCTTTFRKYVFTNRLSYHPLT